MSEVFRLNSYGKVAYDLLVNTDTGTIRKNIWYLPDYDKANWEPPDRQTYERLIGGSIELLTDPSWKLGAMLPGHITCRIEETRSSFSGYQAVIEMDFIKGQPIPNGPLPPEIASQLSAFIKGSTVMADTTRKETGRIFLPDLLGGVVHPYDRFQNFIVETATGKIYFVDTYPLARVPRRRLVPNVVDLLGVRAEYRRHLLLAAYATGSKEVIAETGNLVHVIQGD